MSDLTVHEPGVCPHCGVPVVPGQGSSCAAKAPAADGGLLVGNRTIDRMGRRCCGKPQGCMNPTGECLYQTHPFKRHLYRP